MDKNVISPEMKNLFFTALQTQNESALHDAGIYEKTGGLKEITYILNGNSDKHFQRLFFEKVSFEKKRDEIIITDSEVETFLQSVGMKWKEEKPKIKFVFIKMIFATHEIFYEQTNKDGSKISTAL